MRKSLIIFALVLIIEQVKAFRFGVPFRERRLTPSLCANKGAPPQTAYSYVEGGDYEDRYAEIEAMGGDPFFLTDDEMEQSNEDMDEPFSINLETPMRGPDPTAEEERYATDGKGPTPPKLPKKKVVEEDWEWDGTVDEDAHMYD